MTDGTGPSSRSTAVMLALGLLLFGGSELALTLLVDPAEAPAGSAAATRTALTIQENEATLTATAYISMFAAGLVAVAALARAMGTQAGRAVSGRIAWSGLAIGTSLLVAAYGLRATTLVSLGLEHTGNEAVFAALLSGVMGLFGVGALLFSVAAALVVAGEARQADATAPKWLLWTTVAAWAVAALGPVGALLGTPVGPVEYAAVAAMLGSAWVATTWALPAGRERPADKARPAAKGRSTGGASPSKGGRRPRTT